MREAEDAIEVVHDKVPVLFRLHSIDDLNSELYHDLIPDLHPVVELNRLIVFWDIAINKGALDYVRITGGNKRLFNKVILDVVLRLLLILEEGLLVPIQIFIFLLKHLLLSMSINK